MSNTFRAIGPTTFLSPIPAVMLSCRGTEPGFDRDNLITIAWAGVINSDPPMISVSIRPERHSYSQIVQSGVFCLNLIGRSLCRATDYCGVKSGRDVDKFKETGLHAREVEGFPAPALDEAPAFLFHIHKEGHAVIDEDVEIFLDYADKYLYGKDVERDFSTVDDCLFEAE